jgi:alkanesulfonate monooxygenase SsuD/methylene tetrahydromethanopterin reductase-like flavin-dependent oxidoreductase (luciferase family)
MCVYTTVRIEDDVAMAEATTTEFLKKYYGGGGSHGGLMGLGPPQRTIEMLKRYEAAGVTEVCIRFAGADQQVQLERFVCDVVPAFA